MTFSKIYVMIAPFMNAPVAQLDRALASGAKGREFESRRARHSPQCFSISVLNSC